ncbi:MAG: acyl-CoA dehydrogenase family protein [Myxococcales bacterium]|nr:acyl-CoA dehydrogenase family protein [Myxococcales bacterium]
MSNIEVFRSEARAWLEQNAPEEIRGKAGDPSWHYSGGRKASFHHPAQERWFAMMRERGWTAPDWPVEYGGGGLGAQEAAALKQELARLKLPPPLEGMGLSMIGPTLLQVGSPEQCREHLPKITSGQIRWCQGYSEPSAGSDLASLQTSARQVEDRFIINGQKIWTSGAHLADWIFMLTRTDSTAPKHLGITFVLLDLDQPGVEVRQIQMISGASPFCETFFTDAVADPANVIGGVNRGWTVAKVLLTHERSGSGPGNRPGTSSISRALAAARDKLGEQDGRVRDPIVRDKLAQLAMDQQCLQLTMQRSVDSRKAGEKPGPETSIFKLCRSEVSQHHDELMMTINGPEALGWEGDGFSEQELTQTRAYLRGRGGTIAAGTSEINLNIIAKRVLGLPD